MFFTLGSAHGNHDNMFVATEHNVNLVNGMNNISILSATVGLPVIVSIVCLVYNTKILIKNHTNKIMDLNEMYIYFYMKNSGAYLERRVAGLRKVKVQGRDFTNYSWGYQVITSAYNEILI
jgi:hypothetical protein